MYAIAGYLLVLIYLIAGLSILALVLIIVAAIVLSIYGCIEDKKYYEKGE